MRPHASATAGFKTLEILVRRDSSVSERKCKEYSCPFENDGFTDRAVSAACILSAQGPDKRPHKLRDSQFRSRSKDIWLTLDGPVDPELFEAWLSSGEHLLWFDCLRRLRFKSVLWRLTW